MLEALMFVDDNGGQWLRCLLSVLRTHTQVFPIYFNVKFNLLIYKFDNMEKKEEQIKLIVNPFFTTTPPLETDICIAHTTLIGEMILRTLIIIHANIKANICIDNDN